MRVVCLPPAERADGRLDLARIGANARRATEDSSAVAYIAPPSRANRFSHPILEQANISQLTARSGAAMSELLDALERAAESGGSLRQAASG